MFNVQRLLEELRAKSAGVVKSMPSAAETEAAAAAAAALAAEAAANEADAAAVLAAEAGAAETAAADAAAAEAAATDAAALAAAEAEAAREAGEVGKSFTVTGPDGQPRQAIDGFEMLKSMQAEITALRTELADHKSAVLMAEPTAGEGDVAKSFGEQMSSFELVTEEFAKSLGEAFDALRESGEKNAALEARIEQQAEGLAAADAAFAAQALTIKALSEQVSAFGETGRGRQSIVVPQDRPGALPTTAKAVTIGEIFAKATELNKAGVLTGFDVARVNTSVNSGRGVPADLQQHFAA